jgi:hypothetical protein
MATMYWRFSKDGHHVDFSEEAAVAMYEHENGVPLPQTKHSNGYALGKKWMEVTIAMWRKDIANGLLTVQELLDDGFPEWFLNKIGLLRFRRETR